MIEWYSDWPKLLRANNLTLFVSSSIISIVIVIPLNTEFTQLSFFNSLKLNGHPFFNTSFEFSPSSSIIALEWDKSVIAKSLSLNVFWIVSIKSFFFDVKSQFLGPHHKILVSLLLLTFCASSIKLRPSILISFIEEEEFLNWTIWTIN